MFDLFLFENCLVKNVLDPMSFAWHSNGWGRPSVVRWSTRAQCMATLQFVRNLKPNATLYIEPQQFQENYFTPWLALKWYFWGLWVGYVKFSFVNIRCATINSKGLSIHTILAKRVFNYCYPYFQGTPI